MDKREILDELHKIYEFAMSRQNDEEQLAAREAYGALYTLHKCKANAYTEMKEQLNSLIGKLENEVISSTLPFVEDEPGCPDCGEKYGHLTGCSYLGDFDNELMARGKKAERVMGEWETKNLTVEQAKAQGFTLYTEEQLWQKLGKEFENHLQYSPYPFESFGLWLVTDKGYLETYDRHDVYYRAF